MSTKIRRVEYFHAMVRDQPGEAYQLLSYLKSLGVNLLAFNVVPIGAESAQVIFFPEQPEHFVKVAGDAGISLIGPQRAFLVQGDNELGALSEIHRTLFEGNVNVDSSIGVADDRGGYGYIVYIRASDYERAADVLRL